MKAIIYNQYGSPEVLKLKEVNKPTPEGNQVLINIKATAVNSADLRLRKADPFLVRLVFGIFKPKPKYEILGVVFAGVVEKVGVNVSKYKVGDEVFGISEKTMGTYAEYICLDENVAMSLKPQNTIFEEAASIPFGGHTALHFLKKSKIQIGQKILVYGASGAVGSSVVQLAKYYGAEVTAVCSTENIEMVKSLGASRVLDYTKNELDNLGEKFDIVFETVDKTKVFKIANLVKENGTLILGAVLIKGALQGFIASKLKNFMLVAGVAEVGATDVEFLKKLTEEGNLKPVIDRIYPLEEMVEAHKYAEKGHKKGNVVIRVG